MTDRPATEAEQAVERLELFSRDPGEYYPHDIATLKADIRILLDRLASEPGEDEVGNVLCGSTISTVSAGGAHRVWIDCASQDEALFLMDALEAMARQP